MFLAWTHMTKASQQRSLYLLLGIIIISTVSFIMFLSSAYIYTKTKEKIITEIKYDSNHSMTVLQQNLEGLVASYAINDYDNLVATEMSDLDHFAIVIEDYNMGEILGKKAYVSGKIRNAKGDIIDFDSDNSQHLKSLNNCYFSNKGDIKTSTDNIVGTITICVSNEAMNEELNNIIMSTIVNVSAISALLIFSLLISIRLFILKPISNIVNAIKNTDDDGVPLKLIDEEGSSEIYTLSHTMNKMISSIKDARLEQKKNEEIIRSSQKMDAVGQLTGGIAHDFNNLLGIIMGNLELLRMSLSNQPVELKRVDNALSGTRRGAQLTRKLLNFSRKNPQRQDLTFINPFINNLEELIAKSLTTIIQVELHLADSLWPVNVDPGDLENAILNLSINARDAMPDGGVLVIESANKHFDTEYVRQHPGTLEGDYVMISVSDTGSGISAEARKEIFTPFFTTKEFGKGTGLGLSMVYGFIKRSQGHIELYSEEGKGSTFHLYLPRAFGEHEKVSVEEKIEPIRGNETVLIVDDEVVLATTAESYLQMLGYKTYVATNVSDALKILSINNIDLIFSDVVMPNKNGFELAYAALEQNKLIKIQLTSGFTSKHTELTNGHEKIYKELSQNILTKPYTLSELSIAVRNTLDKQEQLLK